MNNKGLIKVFGEMQKETIYYSYAIGVLIGMVLGLLKDTVLGTLWITYVLGPLIGWVIAYKIAKAFIGFISDYAN